MIDYVQVWDGRTYPVDKVLIAIQIEFHDLTIKMVRLNGFLDYTDWNHDLSENELRNRWLFIKSRAEKWCGLMKPHAHADYWPVQQRIIALNNLFARLDEIHA